jgi:ABC-type Fe3+-citrate transport system substrate-binding protein
VGKVIPEIVEWSQDPQYANTMDYTRIISFLVEAVKEQQKKIDLLAERLNKIDV